MALINPKPRFAYDNETCMIYDYVDGRDVPITGQPYQALDGQWDLVRLRDLICTGQQIDSARLNANKRPPAAKPKPVAKPAPAPAPAAPAQPAGKAGDTALSEPEEDSVPNVTAAGTQALTAPELQALRLTDLQRAALGITPAMYGTTGLSTAQKQALGINAARAKMLELTPEQVAALAI